MVSYNEFTLWGVDRREPEFEPTLHDELNQLRGMVYSGYDFDIPEEEPMIALEYYIHPDYLEPVYDFVNIADNLNDRDIYSIPDMEGDPKHRLWFVVDNHYHTAVRIWKLEDVMMDNCPDANEMTREDYMVPWIFTTAQNDAGKQYRIWTKMSPKEPDTHRLMALVNARTSQFLLDYALRLDYLEPHGFDGIWAWEKRD